MKTRLLVPAVLATATIGFAGIPATAANAETPSASPSDSPTPTDAGQTPDGNTSEPENAGGGADTVVTVSSDSLTESESASEGVTISGNNLDPQSSYKLSASSEEGTGESIPVTVQEDGTFTVTLGGTGTPLSVGTTTAQLTYQDDAGSTVNVGDPVTFEVTADAATDEPTETATPSESATPAEAETPAQVERAITITPEEIDVDDFVQEDKGVVITVVGLEPGETATLSVDPEPENVTDFEIDQVVNEDGEAIFNVYGTNSSSPEVYLGTYDVVVGAPSSEDGLLGSFEVVDGAGNGGGNTDEDEAGSGGQLPRTGTEMTGLAVGASLLVLGAGTILVTRRSNKATGIADA